MYQHIGKRIRKLGLKTSHWTIGNRGLHHRGGARKKTAKEILKLHKATEPAPSTGQARRALVESGVPYCCKQCGCPPKWLSKTLVLQIDHISGNRRDWRIENLRFLCPNCHSQTMNFGSRKNAIGRTKGCRNGMHFAEMVGQTKIELATSGV